MSKSNKKNDDDGRVIAPMNVEGMPWYDRRKPKSHAEASGKKAPEPISSEDTRRIIFRVYFVMLPIILLFFGVFALVIWVFLKL